MASTGDGNPQIYSNLDMYLAGLVAIVALGPTVLTHFVAIEASFSWTQIVAMMWYYMVEESGPVLVTVFTQPLFFALLPLLVIPRLYFISMIKKLYNEKTTRKRVFRIGIIAEIWLPAVYYLPLLPFAILAPWTIGGIPITIPIPILFIAGMYMLRRIPTRGMPTTWAEVDGSEDWWEEQSATSEKEQVYALNRFSGPF
ncbi:MAG: hypothetical protein ACXADC_16990 [Candidatus Thorarchaeota archaeon]